MKNTPDEIIEIVQAFKAGKRIEVEGDSGKWRHVDDPSWNFGVCFYRIAPEPPKPKLRPWRPEEVPVGALIYFPGYYRKGVIAGIVWNALNNKTQLFCGFQCVDSDRALKDGWQHSTDGGKTWKPCGAEE